MAFSFDRDKELEGVVAITPFHVADIRGDFVKYYEKEIFRVNDIEFDVFEEFTTTSEKNVIRGLHFQTEKPQAKLVTVLAGAVFDVIVDLRLHSDTFCKWKGYVLSAENKMTLYIPKGFAHGFYTLENVNIVSYKCDSPYLQQCDSGIVWNDSKLNIKWPIENGIVPIISQKDEGLSNLDGFQRLYGGF